MRGQERAGSGTHTHTRTSDLQDPGVSRASITTESVLECAARGMAEDVIARLLRNHDLRGPPSSAFTPGQVEALCEAVLSPEAGAAQDLVEEARDRGVLADALYLDYIAEAARRLGEMWVEDRISFVDVTLGLGRLHEVLRAMGPAMFEAGPDVDPGLSALLAPVPGESHLLGIVMAADFLRRNGWYVDIEVAPTLDALVASASCGRYAMVGISAGSRHMMEPMAKAVAALRKATPDSIIVIGGHITDLEPDIASIVGADIVSTDISTDAYRLKRRVHRGRGE